MNSVMFFFQMLGVLKAHLVYRSRMTAGHTTCSQKSSIFPSGTPKKELESLQKQNIIVPLGMYETSEWCNSLLLVPKANGKVQLYLDLANLNKTLIRPVHRGPTLNDILPRLLGIKYLTVIDASSGNHKLKLDEKPPYLTIFSCPFDSTNI